MKLIKYNNNTKANLNIKTVNKKRKKERKEKWAIEISEHASYFIIYLKESEC